jgi:hypothetical protein
LSTNKIIDLAVAAAAKLGKPGDRKTAEAWSAAIPVASAVLPKIVPFVARVVRQYPVQTAVSVVGLLLLARRSKQMNPTTFRSGKRDTQHRLASRRFS